ncbi:MAG: diaminopimelate decarboxylase [Candidatus Omnitrophota bacterium]
MHYFNYKGKDLYCESVKVENIVNKVGTPCYIYSNRTLIEHYQKIQSAFKKIKPLVCFSLKSNSNLAVISTLVKEGAGLDIVSGGELYRALKVKVDPKKIVYAGVGKRPDEIDEALKKGILFFNVESIPELEMINARAKCLKKKANVCIRVNPGVDAHTHHYITTGTHENKFGIDFDTMFEIFDRSDEFKNVNIRGLHVHIGSQITQISPFVKAVKKVAVVINSLREKGYIIDYLNIGGGLGIVYKDDKPKTASDFAKAIEPLIVKLGVKLVLEPGRFIAGNSGILLTKVVYVKKALYKKFLIVDAAMNDLLRPSLYEAYHNIVPIKKFNSRKKEKFDVVGPICESGDFLAKARILPSPKQDEYLAVMSAGAYGFTMSSNYNSRTRAAEVMVTENKFYTVRDREEYSDLIKGEKVPEALR